MVVQFCDWLIGCLHGGAVLSCPKSVQAQLQAAADWNSAAEQPRGTLSSAQLPVVGKVQVTTLGSSVF